MYRGRFKRFIVDHDLDLRLGRFYWAGYRTVAENERVVRVGEATAAFSLSTYPEYHAVNAVEGAERPIVAKILGELRPHDVFWDIGANIGTFSCLAGDVLAAGTVVAFEPYPPNIEKLRQNLESNDVDAIVKTSALSDAPGGGTFFVLDTEQAGTPRGSIDTSYVSMDDVVGTVDVEITTGDRLVAGGEVPLPNVVKIDVEGAAPLVLTGMVDSIRQPDCRLVVVEPHDNRTEIEQRLLEVGFRIDGVRLANHRSEESPTIFGYDPNARHVADR